MAKMSERVLRHLMAQEGLTRKEAESMYKDAKEAVMEAIKNGEDAMSVFEDEFGLEPDYLIDVIL